MPKCCAVCLILLLFSISKNSLAQEDENLILKSAYSGKYYGSPYNIRRDFFQKSESGRFNISSAADAQLILTKGLSKEVRAVELGDIPAKELPGVIATLKLYPGLAYIRILGRGTLQQNEKINLIAANIKGLSHLKGIEFAYTDLIDMDDALKKLIPLKQISILSFTEYKQQLPATITELKQIDSIKLNVVNIGSNDLSTVNWEKASIIGSPKSWNNASEKTAKIDEPALLSLTKIKSLKSLNLYMGLRYPDFISKFKQIETLNVFYFEDTWPTAPFFNAIGALNQLQHLWIEVSTDAEIDISGLANLTQLRSVSLKLNTNPSCKIDVLGNLKNLELLEIAQARLGVLPDIFKDLHQLKTVGLINDEITRIPVSLFNLPALENLNLSFNQITALPDIVDYSCKNLKTFIATENQIAALPKAFEGLMQLEIVNCSVNKIRSIPAGWEYLKNLKEVNFARNGLSTFPEGLQNNHNVEKVILMFNPIESFPDIVGDDFKLHQLAITGNRFMTELPERIGSYTQLDTLEAEHLNLNGLPESLGNCKQLKFLLLNNSIKAYTILPQGLKDAKDLEVLQLNDNPLLKHQSIFDVILSQPRKDFMVSLSGNNISQLPATKKWLTIPFKNLNLGNNPIKDYPPDFIASKVKGEVTYPKLQ